MLFYKLIYVNFSISGFGAEFGKWFLNSASKLDHSWHVAGGESKRKRRESVYYAFASLASLYSMLAAILLVTYFYMKHVYGIQGSTKIINQFAGTKKIVVFELYSYLSLVVWFAFALPWVDLFTFQWFSHFENEGLRTYFGWMTDHEASIYFVVMFFNILGAKAAMTLAELAGLLRKGRVRMVPHGIFFVWMRAE